MCDQVRSGILSIRFKEPPPWLGKKLTIKGHPKLITAEPPGKCSLCKKSGHTSWGCTEGEELTLGDVQIQGVIGPVGADTEADVPGDDLDG